MEILKEYNNNFYLNQTESKLDSETNIRPEFNKKSKIADYFDYIYSYPPKIKIKWDRLDDLKDDFFISSKLNSIGYDPLCIYFMEDRGFETTPEEALTGDYKSSQYLNGFLNKINSSNFFLKKTKSIQSALANVPVFVILNGHGEIVLSKPSNVLGSKTPKTYFNEKLYDYCGGFDQIVEKKSELGLFFLNYSDAENYFKEVARSDFEGTNTVSLSIHCTNLDSAYKITREYHPGIDFRFVPNFKEVKELLAHNIDNSDLIFANGQQQLRLRQRNVNLFPYLNKLGKYFSPSFSSLQRNEYFKGTPIYIVQISEEPKNVVFAQYFNIASCLDSLASNFEQYVNLLTGYGHNRIIEGSVRHQNSSKLVNYIFFEKDQATKFCRKNARKVSRYNGSLMPNLGSIIRKPRIFVYNLEDFLEDWEDNINEKLGSDQSIFQTVFNSKENLFVTPTIDSDEIDIFSKETNEGFLKNLGHSLNVKVRVFKRIVGVFFSL